MSVVSARGNATSRDVVPHAPRIGVTRSLLSVLIGAGLDATRRLKSGRIAGVAEGTLIPFSARFGSSAEVATRAASESLIIVRAAIDGEAGGAGFDETASSGAVFSLGVPKASGISGAVDLIEVTEATLLDASVVDIVPFADSTSVFARSLLTLERARSAADLTIPDAARIEVASGAAEPIRFAGGVADVGLGVPHASGVDVACCLSLSLAVLVVGGGVAVAVVLALAVDVVPHAGRVGGASLRVEVLIVALLLADSRCGVPFAHGRLFARSLRGKSGASFGADATLSIPVAILRGDAIDLVEVLHLARALAALIGNVAPSTSAFFVAATLRNASLLVGLRVTSTTLSSRTRINDADEFGLPLAIGIRNAGGGSGFATTRELTGVHGCGPLAVSVIALSLSGIAKRALLVA